MDSCSIEMATVTVICPFCEGEGVVPSPDADDFTLNEVCAACGGEGYMDAETGDETITD